MEVLGSGVSRDLYGLVKKVCKTWAEIQRAMTLVLAPSLLSLPSLHLPLLPFLFLIVHS